jgi:hypothetical protein
MWTSPAGERGTTINRVRLRGAAGLDALSARLRAGRAIEQAAEAVTLPAGAILCVRRLRDPRPGRVSLSAVQAPPEEWTHAVGAALADLAHRAARPAADAVGADAEAVIFDDHAQMLACLAADWCRGALAERWWWRVLIGSRTDADAVLRAWLQHPAHIAAAMEAVAQHGFAAAFVAHLTERETSMLIEAVVRMHGLDRRLASMSRSEERSVAPRDSAVATEPVHVPPREARHIGGVDPPPWRDSVPEACVRPLRADHQQFLGIALTVRRDPTRARDRAFVQQVEEWREQIAAAERTAAATRGAPAAAPAVAMASHRSEVEWQVAEPAPSVGVFQQADDDPVNPRTSSLPSPSAVVPSSIGQAGGVREHERPTAAPGHAAASSVETELGGIFYLLNVAIALGLYGDFTEPRGPSLDVSIWRFIALVGDDLLGHRHRRDPIWRWLDDLAGPDPQSFNGTADWRLDPAWLSAFPEPRTWRWSADGARVRVRHPAGFFVVDVAQSHDQSPAQQARHEVQPYHAVCSLRLLRGRPTVTRTRTPLARWTRWHTAYMRVRLSRALGLPASNVNRLLIRRHARVRLSLTHVEVAFSLRDLPVAIRLSGLDRDPGWIPAADRVVSYRYD